jgi:hypothetical protein
VIKEQEVTHNLSIIIFQINCKTHQFLQRRKHIIEPVAEEDGEIDHITLQK